VLNLSSVLCNKFYLTFFNFQLSPFFHIPDPTIGCNTQYECIIHSLTYSVRQVLLCKCVSLSVRGLHLILPAAETPKHTMLLHLLESEIESQNKQCSNNHTDSKHLRKNSHLFLPNIIIVITAVMMTQKKHSSTHVKCR